MKKMRQYDWDKWVLSITKDNMNRIFNSEFGKCSNAQAAISQFGKENNPRVLHHVLCLRPDLSLLGWQGFALLGNSDVLKIVLSYGYTFPTLIANAVSRKRMCPGDEASVRILFEHGAICPDERYRAECPWVFEIYNDVQQRRTACARVCVALAGVSRRVRSQRDVLSIVMRLVWGTRTRDEWLF